MCGSVGSRLGQPRERESCLYDHCKPATKAASPTLPVTLVNCPSPNLPVEASLVTGAGKVQSGSNRQSPVLPDACHHFRQLPLKPRSRAYITPQAVVVVGEDKTAQIEVERRTVQKLLAEENVLDFSSEFKETKPHPEHYYRCCVSRLLEISKLDGYRAACSGEAN